MNTSGNTILVIGGTAGIGFEIARLFSEKNNQIVITGRDSHRLDQAVSQLKNISGLMNDFSKKEDVETLVKKIGTDFPNTNIVINKQRNTSIGSCGKLIPGSR